MCHAIINQKLAGVSTRISDKVGFVAKKITRDRDGYSIMIQGSAHEENTASPERARTKPQRCKQESQARTGPEGETEIHNSGWRLQHPSLKRR